MYTPGDNPHPGLMRSRTGNKAMPAPSSGPGCPILTDNIKTITRPQRSYVWLIRKNVIFDSRLNRARRNQHTLSRSPFPRQGNSRRRLACASSCGAARCRPMAHWRRAMKDGGGFSVDTATRAGPPRRASAAAPLPETGQERRMDDARRVAALSWRLTMQKERAPAAHASSMPGSVSPRW